jgi:hypothetical protein
VIEITRFFTLARVLMCFDHVADGKRFVVHADEKLTVFLELESEGERGSAVASSLQQLAADFAG